MGAAVGLPVHRCMKQVRAHGRRRPTPGRGLQEGTIGSGSGRLSESSPERKGRHGIQGRGKSLCRWAEGVKTGKALGEDWRT